jgi:hypothetical protein
MNRRHFAFAIPAVVALVAESSHVAAQTTSSGVKIRFVLTRIIEQANGSKNRSTIENAVVLRMGEKFETLLGKDYRLSLQPVLAGDAVRVQASLADLERNATSEMTGESLVEIGQGSGIRFSSPGSEIYTLGLLVTSAEIPKGAA